MGTSGFCGGAPSIGDAVMSRCDAAPGDREPPLGGVYIARMKKKEVPERCVSPHTQRNTTRIPRGNPMTHQRGYIVRSLKMNRVIRERR